MPGVQSFVAQRQQGQPNPDRQLLGAEQRVPVPTTKLENPKQKPSFQRLNFDLLANPQVEGPNSHLSKQQPANAPTVQDGFDTDAEGFDDTATISTGYSSRYQQGKGDDRDHQSSRDGPNAASDFSPGVQVSFRREHGQPHHVQGSTQLGTEGSGEEDDQVIYGENADEEEEGEVDEEEFVRHGILRDLNSTAFSQYLQGETVHTTQATFQPLMAIPVASASLAMRNVVHNSQNPAKSFMASANRVNGGAPDPGVDLRGANREARKRAMKQTSAVPFQKVEGTFVQHLSIPAQLAAQQCEMLNHHEPSQQPSVTSRPIQRPMSRARIGVAEDILGTNVQSQANEERLLPVRSGSIDFADDSSTDSDPNFNRRHDRKPTTSVDGPQTRKRARDLDYSSNQLSSMTFQQLSNEPFNLASDTARASVPQELLSGTLEAKMDYILEKLKDDDAKLLQRRAFFSSLLIEQYEECATLMIRRFSDIMSKFTNARQQRRRAAKELEEEVARRERCVRAKTTIVDKDLGRLKRGGEEVVRGAAL